MKTPRHFLSRMQLTLTKEWVAEPENKKPRNSFITGLFNSGGEIGTLRQN